MPNKSKVIIDTKRLKLRPFIEQDWKSVHEYAIDPEISKYQEWGPNSVKDTKSFVRKCMTETSSKSSDVYFFSITIPDKNRHIGGCVLTIEPDNRDEASIGYTIGRKYWLQGFASEAAGALLEFAFSQLHLRRVTANCDASNIASWRVMEKVGMTLAKTEFAGRYFKGEWRDWLEYSITLLEWKNLRS